MTPRYLIIFIKGGPLPFHKERVPCSENKNRTKEQKKRKGSFVMKEKSRTVCGYEWTVDCENYVNHVDVETPSMWKQQSWSAVVAFRPHGQVRDPIKLGVGILIHI
jgi:hypothetical protein